MEKARQRAEISMICTLRVTIVSYFRARAGDAVLRRSTVLRIWSSGSWQFLVGKLTGLGIRRFLPQCVIQAKEGIEGEGASVSREVL